MTPQELEALQTMLDSFVVKPISDRLDRVEDEVRHLRDYSEATYVRKDVAAGDSKAEQAVVSHKEQMWTRIGIVFGSIAGTVSLLIGLTRH